MKHSEKEAYIIQAVRWFFAKLACIGNCFEYTKTLMILPSERKNKLLGKENHTEGVKCRKIEC